MNEHINEIINNDSKLNKVNELMLSKRQQKKLIRTEKWMANKDNIKAYKKVDFKYNKIIVQKLKKNRKELNKSNKNKTIYKLDIDNTNTTITKDDVNINCKIETIKFLIKISSF